MRELIAANLHIEVLPGANAALIALVLSGLPCDRFYFEGFLPHKKGRRTRWEFLSTLPVTFILYESPHRLVRCLDEIITHCGPERSAAVCRELTKLHEEVVRGSAQYLHEVFSERESIKGEIVVVVGGV